MDHTSVVMHLRLRHSTEATRIELFTRLLALLMLSLLALEARVIKPIGFKHNDLVVAFIVVIAAGPMSVLGMARHSAVRVLMTTTRMVRRDDRLLHVIAGAASASIDSDLLVRGLLEPLG